MPELIVDLVTNNALSEERINTFVRRILSGEFKLEFFNNSYLDEVKAADIARQRDSGKISNSFEKRSYTDFEKRD